MSDLISRQALCGYALNQKDKSVTPNDIMRFQSAQPYTDKELQKIQDLEQAQFDKIYELGYQAGCAAQPEIIRCKDCKWKNNHNCTRAVEIWIDDDKYCAWAERREE